MAEKVRLQIKKTSDPEAWSDVGPNGESIPVSIEPGLAIELYISSGAMAMLLDDASGTFYQGWAEPGSATSAASWRIIRIVLAADTTITFADGNRNLDNIWDNRTILNYL